MLATAAGFAMLRWQVPVVAISVFGLPILFAVYLREIDVWRSRRGRYFALAAVVALGLGVGWALIAGPIVADAYHAALGGQMAAAQLFLCGVAIPITYGLAMVAPAILVRAVDRSSGESLDGFTIGAVGATVVNAAATGTLLAPQLAMGVTAESHSVGSLLAEAMVEGVAWPLGAVAIGGVFGIALWFIPTANAPRRYRKAVVVPGALLGSVAFSVAMGIVDVAPLPLGTYIALAVTHCGIGGVGGEDRHRGRSAARVDRRDRRRTLAVRGVRSRRRQHGVLQRLWHSNPRRFANFSGHASGAAGVLGRRAGRGLRRGSATEDLVCARVGTDDRRCGRRGGRFSGGGDVHEARPRGICVPA